jgi:uncharacterized protein YjbJ (UPF0337 family)
MLRLRHDPKMARHVLQRTVRGRCGAPNGGPMHHASTPGVATMNKNQVKGEVKNLAGKVQEGAGKLTGSKEQQVKGLGKQIAGKAQSSVGDVQQAVSDSKHR